MRLDQVRETEEGYDIRFTKRWFTLDPTLVPLMRRWLTQRREISTFEASGSSPYLFPGRTGTHIVPASGDTYRRKYKITSRQGRTTAIAALIRHGMSQARMLTDCLGISIARAHDYCAAFAMRDLNTAAFVRHRYA